MQGAGCHLTFIMKGGGTMDTYQAINLMIMFGILLISLISYLNRGNNRKK